MKQNEREQNELLDPGTAPGAADLWMTRKSRMNELNVKVMLVKDSRAELPKYMSPGAAGCDLVSVDDVSIQPGETLMVSTGVYLEIPEGFEGQVRSRSGSARRQGLVVLNSPGTIDSDYRGEIKLLMHNTSKVVRNIRCGDRCAQIVFAPVMRANFVQVEKLSETHRSSNGFGSTGT